MHLLKTLKYIILIFMGITISNAQVKEVFREIKKIEFNINQKKVEERKWKRSGNLSISFGQHHYENWVGGGTGKLEIFGKLSQKLTYQNESIVWDNNLDILYGMNKVYEQDLSKTSDQITFNSIFGKKVNPEFSYSFFLKLQTQLTNSYLSANKDPEQDYRVSGFLSPLYISSGPGIMWRKKNHFVMNIAPASLKTTYLNGKIYTFDKSSKSFLSNLEKEIYGVSPYKKINYQLGFYSSIYSKINVLKNISIENKLSLYSDYLNDPKNVDLDYIMNIDFKINKLISTNLILQTTYDDDVFSGFQIREHFGVGFKLGI